jgi:hypothetical protein
VAPSPRLASAELVVKELMPGTVGSSPTQSHEPHTLQPTRGFVAAIGPGAAAIRLAVPDALGVVPTQRDAAGGMHVLTFGSPTDPPTLQVAPAVRGYTWGRPFSIDSSGALANVDLSSPRSVDRALLDIDGRFALLLISPDGDVVAATDLIGACAIYHATAGDTVLVATHLGPLLASLPRFPELDRFGFAALLATLGCPTGQTPFAGVRRLASGSYLHVRIDNERARVEERQYGDVADLIAGPELPLDVPALIDEFDARLEAAITREQLPPTVGLPVSSGRDSRCLGLVLLRDPDRRLETMTYGTRGSRDLRGGRDFAELYGLPHRSWHYRRDDLDLARAARFIVGLEGGTAGLQTAHRILGFADLRTRAPIAVSGWLFGVLTGAHQATSHNHGGPPRFVVEGLVNDPVIDLERAFPDEIAALLDELTARERRLTDLTDAQRHVVLDLTVRQATHTSSAMNLNEWHIDVAFPGYSRDLISFWSRVPPVALGDRSLYDAWRGTAAARVSDRVVRAPLSSRVRTALEQSADELRRPPPVVDWDPWFRRSGQWIRETSLQCADPDIRALCLTALESTLRTKVSGIVLLFAMAVLSAPELTAAS